MREFTRRRRGTAWLDGFVIKFRLPDPTPTGRVVRLRNEDKFVEELMQIGTVIGVQGPGNHGGFYIIECRSSRDNLHHSEPKFLAALIERIAASIGYVELTDHHQRVYHAE